MNELAVRGRDGVGGGAGEKLSEQSKNKHEKEIGTEIEGL